MTGGHRLVALFGEISCAHFQEHHADERNSGDVARADDAEGWFAFPLSELYWRKGCTRSKILAAFFAVMTTVAMAGLWEIVEWLYAVIDGGEAGAAFLGSQGDEWDAQKDILCDTFGAVCSGSFFLLLNRNVQIDVRCKCKWVLPKIAPPASFRDFIK